MIFGFALPNDPTTVDTPFIFEIHNVCAYSNYDANIHCGDFSCRLQRAIRKKPCIGNAIPLPHEVAEEFIPAGVCKSASLDYVLLFLPAEEDTTKEEACAYIIDKSTLRLIIKNTNALTKKLALLQIYMNTFIFNLYNP